MLTVADACVSKSYLLFERSNLELATKTVKVFSLKWKAHLIFKNTPAKYPSLNNQFIYQSCFQVKMVLCGRWWGVASLACNSNDHTNAFPRDSHHILVCSRIALCVLCMLTHRIFLKDVYLRTENKTSNFYCFIRDMKWNALYFLRVHSVKNRTAST